MGETVMAEIRTAHLFTLKLKAAAPQMVGALPLGERRVVEVTDGTFEGERMRGSLVKGGAADWILVRPDATLLDVRLVLKTDTGALIGMTYRGIRHGPADVIAKVNRGEPVDPSLYYFRTAVFFETSAKDFDWLNRTIALGTGQRNADGPVYDVFEVL
jgi:hypothetical protein